MRTLRFFHENIPEQNQIIHLTAEESWHIGKVLRLKTDHLIYLMDGQGTIAKCTLQNNQIKNRQTTLPVLIQEKKYYPAPTPKIDLYVAPPKNKLMQTIIQMATQLGTATITPIICKYSEPSTQKNNKQKWQKEAINTIKQSSNPYLPTINNPISINQAISTAPLQGFLGAVPQTTTAQLPPIPKNTTNIALWIGPEAGFTNQEETTLLKRYHPLTIGSWILKIETAVPALLATIQYQLNNQTQKIQ